MVDTNILLAPIFCDFLACRVSTTRLGQCRRKSAHISWPAGCSQLLSICMGRQHLQDENTSQVRASYCRLCQDKTVRRCSLDFYVYNFCVCIYFVNANILLTPIFCQHLSFVDLIRNGPGFEASVGTVESEGLQMKQCRI